VGPDFLTLALTAVISSITGGGWIASKVLERHKERLKDRMPLEYVLKVDFVRELQDMNDHFRAIHNKLDKLMEKLIER